MGDILVVDLDGTLLRSDMLYESFWSAAGRDWRSPVRSALALAQGKAALKRYLAGAARIDVTTLPYDPEVIAYIERWRAEGGKTALVTASDQAIADAIGAHLGIFDDIHGSDGTENLKGQRKAAFLIKRYGERAYSYMGDSTADVAVWAHAKRAITVNADAALRNAAESAAEETEHLATHSPTARSYLKALRPHQWMKNILVFLPMLTSHVLEGTTFVMSLLAFISFSLVASSVYVLNDLLDLNADRAHASKKHRPFASGAIPIASGTWMAAALLIAGTIFAAFVSWQFIAVMAIYYALTLAYSLYLKRQVVIDICVLALLYTLRILAGSTATQIPLTVWFFAFSMFFFLSLAAVKRQAELVDNAKQGKIKARGRGYHVDDLPIIPMISFTAGYAAVLILALYISSPAVVVLYDRPSALWGVCGILLYWITRTILITHRGEMHDDPVVYAVKDQMSRFCFLAILLFVVGGALL